jgi:hypothetical protein
LRAQHTNMPADPPTVLRGRVTERRFLQKVIDLARLYKWRVYHTYDSRGSERGFPDLLMVREHRLVFAELKTTTGRVSKPQREWLEALSGVPHVETYIFRPEDDEAIQRLLKPEPKPQPSPPRGSARNHRYGFYAFGGGREPVSVPRSIVKAAESSENGWAPVADQATRAELTEVSQRRVLYLHLYEGGRLVERRSVAVVAAEAPERSEREFRTAGEIANALLRSSAR